MSTSFVSNLMEMRNMIDQILEGGGINASSLKALKGMKLTKSGKVRKESVRKGQPTCYSGFVTKIMAEKKDEFAAWTAANPEKKRGGSMTFVSNYKKEHEEEYTEFERVWKQAHPKSETQSEAPEDSQSQAEDSQGEAEEEPVVVAPPVIVETVKPKKGVRKAAITTPVVTPSGVSTLEEFLPFTIDGTTYLRKGCQRSDGNHLWTSGHLWKSNNGVKSKYAGELVDGTINKTAKEPSV
jgi:hypothetical protein